MSFSSQRSDSSVASHIEAQNQLLQLTTGPSNYNNRHNSLDDLTSPQLSAIMGYRSLSSSLPRGIPSPNVGMSPEQWCNSFDSASCFPTAYHAMQTSPCREPSLVSGVSGREHVYPDTPTSQVDFTLEPQFAGAAGPVVMSRGASVQSRGCWADEPLFSAVPIPQQDWDQKQDLFGLGMGLPQFDPSASTMFASQDLGAAVMSRSISNTSSSSTKSSASNKERREQDWKERMRKANSQQIAPRPSAKDSGATRSKKDTKPSAGGSQSKYHRPSHPKVFCPDCHDQPSFRGDHELRRHIAAKHEGVVKRFVCRDPATVGIQSNLVPMNPLSRCKSCQSGKQYGAYYNAAAHLRRVHFSPKADRGRNKSDKGQHQRRGGKAGGNSPDIKDLKAWYTEVSVHLDEPGFSENLDYTEPLSINPMGPPLSGDLFRPSFGVELAYPAAAGYDGILNGDPTEHWNLAPKQYGGVSDEMLINEDLSIAAASSMRTGNLFAVEDSPFLSMAL